MPDGSLGFAWTTAVAAVAFGALLRFIFGRGRTSIDDDARSADDEPPHDAAPH